MDIQKLINEDMTILPRWASTHGLADRLAEFGSDKAHSIVVYCRSGRRSGLAQAVLQENGFEAAFNAGGYEVLLSVKPTED